MRWKVLERAAKRNAVYSNVFQGQTATNFTQPSTVSSTEISCIDAMRSRVACVGAGMWWAPLSDFDSSLNLSMLLRACPFCLYLSNFLISDSFRIHRSFCGLGGPLTSATAPFCEQLIVASWFSFTWAWQACGPMMSYKCNEFRSKTPASSMTLCFLWPNVHTIGVNIFYIIQSGKHSKDTAKIEYKTILSLNITNHLGETGASSNLFLWNCRQSQFQDSRFERLSLSSHARSHVAK